MQKSCQLSTLSIGVLSASLLLTSMGSFAATTNYKNEAYQAAYYPVSSSYGLSDGFYVGLAGGYDSYLIKNHTNRVTSLGSIIDVTQKTYTNGFVGGGFVGYGLYQSQFYLAGEGFWYGSGASGNIDVNTTTFIGQNLQYHATYSVNQEYGLAALPGFKVSEDALVYIRFGYNWAQIKANQNTHSVSGAIVNSNTTSTVGGFSYGIGSELAIYPQVSVRGEFNHTNYNSFHPGTATSSATANPNPFNGNFSPSDNQYMIGILYHFV